MSPADGRSTRTLASLVEPAPGERSTPGTGVVAPRRRKTGREIAPWARVAWPVGAFVVVVALWQLIVSVFDVPEYIMPAPTVVWDQLVDSWPILWDASWVTLSEVLLGFAAATLISIPLAYLIASVRLVEVAVYPLVVVLQTIPKVAVAPLFIVWFGFGIFPKVLLTFLLCFFPLLVDSLTGFKSMDDRLLYITKSMGSSKAQTFWYVRLPAALPSIFSGLKVAIVLAVTGAVVAEFIASNAGLGFLLLRASANLDTALMFADLVVLSVVALILSYVLEFTERFVMPWQHNSK